MKKPRSEMTKKELGKLRYERHYAHVKGKLLKKYKTRLSDVKPEDYYFPTILEEEVRQMMIHGIDRYMNNHFFPYDEIERF